MLFQPAWVERLPLHLRPDRKRIGQLEDVRAQFEIPNETLALRVMRSPTTVRKLLRHCLEDCGHTNDEASERELPAEVLRSILAALWPVSTAPEEVERAMEKIDSLDQLCNYVLSIDEKSSSVLDFMGLGKRIDEILAQEELCCSI